MITLLINKSIKSETKEFSLIIVEFLEICESILILAFFLFIIFDKVSNFDFLILSSIFVRILTTVQGEESKEKFEINT